MPSSDSLSAINTFTLGISLPHRRGCWLLEHRLRRFDTAARCELIVERAQGFLQRRKAGEHIFGADEPHVREPKDLARHLTLTAGDHHLRLIVHELRHLLAVYTRWDVDRGDAVGGPLGEIGR